MLIIKIILFFLIPINAWATFGNPTISDPSAVINGNNDNVGIGTIHPGQSLDVNGTIRSQAFISTNSSAVNTFAGNVGIGTTLPNAPLQVIGGAQFGNQSNAPVVKGDSSNNLILYSQVGNIGIGTIATPTAPISFIGTSYFKNNVGIGSLTPGQQLDVQGTARLNGLTIPTGAVNGYIWTTNSSGVGSWQVAASGSSQWVGTVGGPISYQQNVGINSTVPGQQLDVGGTLRITAFNMPTNAQNNYVLTSDSNGTGTWQTVVSSQWTGSSGSPIYYQQNVGIGSTVPGQKLDVQGTVRTTGFTLSTSPTNNYVLTTDVNGNGTWQAVPNGTQTPWTSAINGAGNSLTNTANVGIGTSLNLNTLDIAGSVSIGTTFAGYRNSPSNGMAIQGNVGIGTSTASFPLQIVGTSSAGTIVSSLNNLSTTTNSSVTFNLGITGTPNAQNVGSQLVSTRTNASSSGDSDLAFKTSAATTMTQDMIIKSTGNIGIGTSLPVGLLDVEGTISPAIFYAKGSSNQNIGIGTAIPISKIQVVGDSSNHVALFHGSTNNSNSLEVWGSSTILGTGVQIQGNTNNGGLVKILTDYSNTEGDFELGTYNNGLKQLYLQKSGNVGINTANPGQQLDVQGTIRISLLGGTISIATGTNACAGTGTLSGGTATISTTCTPSTYQGIFISDGGGGVLANIGALSIGTVTGGTSFVVNSANALDSSNFSWEIHKTS